MSTDAKEAPLRPLFFHTPQVINLDRHEHARLRRNLTMEYARPTNSIPLTMSDLAEAAKHYPIVFTRTDPIIPIAVVGLEHENYFLDEEGNWLAGHYVPSYVRKYPFVFVDVPEQQKFTLCVDEAVLTFDENAEGTRLYENGHPSAFTSNALEFCAAYQEQHRQALEFCAALSAKEMLMAQRSDITLANGRATQLGGFQLINPEMLPSLDNETVLDWYHRGWIAQIYYVLQSQTNWKRLLEHANRVEEARA